MTYYIIKLKKRNGKMIYTSYETMKEVKLFIEEVKNNCMACKFGFGMHRCKNLRVHKVTEELIIKGVKSV